MARNSSVVFTCGNGSSGTGTPNAVQIGSQPSPVVQSSSRFGSAVARTSAL